MAEACSRKIDLMSLQPTDERLLVYGAGSFGMRLALAIAARRNGPVTVVDREYGVSLPDPLHYQCIEESSLGGRVVFLGIHNPLVNIQRLTEEILSRGAVSVLTPPIIQSWLLKSGIAFSNYWLDTAFDYNIHEEGIAWAREQFADEESRTCFDRVIRYRKLGRVTDSRPQWSDDEQYFPTDFDYISPRMRFVDIGSFDGDTIRALQSREIDVDAVFAFEPDPRNYELTRQTLTSWNDVDTASAPLAAWHTSEMLMFRAEGTPSSAAAPQGDIAVQAVALDDLLLAWKPSHIKLDIEGAEGNALVGLRATLEVHRPRLAISAYHHAAHLWELLRQLSQLDLGYSYRLRGYAEQTFDTVLYAVPAPSP